MHFVGLAYQHKDIVFILIIKYSNLRDFGPSVAYAIGPSVTTSSTDFSFQNLVFCNLFEFSRA